MKILTLPLLWIFLASFWGCSTSSRTKDTVVLEVDRGKNQKETVERQKAQERAKRQKAIQEAIGIFRNFEKDPKDGKEPAFELAWKTILGAGPEGAEALKSELDKVAASIEGDDSFETAASLMLWEIGGLDEAEEVAKIWNRIPLNQNYNGVFFAALEAARTRDSRAYPMLKACLASQDGKVFVYGAKMQFAWPVTHEILFGIYGPVGLPLLAETLRTTTNTVVQKSAIRILTAAGYIEAIPSIRALSERGIGPVKWEAQRALGNFGHPDDFDRLILGLSSDTPDEVIACAYALLNFQDLRATPHVMKLIDSENSRIQSAALSTVSYLLTKDSFDVVSKCAKKEREPAIRKQCRHLKEKALQKMGMGAKKYAAQNKARKIDIINNVHIADAISHRLEPADPRLTAKQLSQTLAEWKKNQSLQGGTLEWVRSRHVIGAATQKDIDRLRGVHAAFYEKLSGPAIQEAGILSEIIKHLTRRVYRKETGIGPLALPPS